MRYEAIVIGVSFGGLNALKMLFSEVPAKFTTPILVVQHISARSDSNWISLLDQQSRIKIKEAEEKETIEGGKVYIAPPNYHLLIEKDRSLSFTIDERVNFARPSIDVLFETAAEAYGRKLIGLILTGSNHDGASGMKYIQAHGGLTIVEDPLTAESPIMPQATLALIKPDYVLPLKAIAELLIHLDAQNNNNYEFNDQN